MNNFAPGELVVVRKQMTTTDAQGPAKTRLKARGPYRVIEQVREGTYKIQKLPPVRRHGRPGRVIKESAARMERIPSPLILHKPTNGIDTRLATYHHAMVDNALESTIGIFEHGEYRPAPANARFAFEKIEDLWQEELDESDDESHHTAESDSSDDDNNDNDHDQDDQHDDTVEQQTHERLNDDQQQNTQDDDHDINNTHLHETQDNKANTPTQEPMLNEQSHNTHHHPTTTEREPPPAATNPTTTSRKRRRTEPLSNHRRTATRKIQLPERYRDTSPPETRTPQHTPPFQHHAHQHPHTLYRKTLRSRDKLFFIRHNPDNDTRYKWHLAQARLAADDTTECREQGEYRIRFFIREPSTSSTRTLRNCRYWPEIHRRQPDGTMGQRIPIRPGKADTLLTTSPNHYMPYEIELNLLQHGIVGPFDFAHPRDYNQEANRIAFEHWEELKDKAEQYHINTDNVEQIIPLR